MFDGKETPSFAKSTKVDVGTHKLLVGCIVSGGLPIYHPGGYFEYKKGELEFVELIVELQEQHKYFVSCRVEDGKPTPYLSDVANWPPLAGSK
jgi:hypothetical protein